MLGASFAAEPGRCKSWFMQTLGSCRENRGRFMNSNSLWQRLSVAKMRASQPETPVSAPGDHACRCLAVVAEPHLLVEPARARVVAHDVKKGSFAALHFAADQF
jgi:hypothetical protein